MLSQLILQSWLLPLVQNLNKNTFEIFVIKKNNFGKKIEIVEKTENFEYLLI